MIQIFYYETNCNLSFTTNKNNKNIVILIITDIIKSLKANEVLINYNISKLSLIGIGISSSINIPVKMFKILSNKGINIKSISIYKIRISVIIDKKYLNFALNILYKSFNLF